MITSKDAKTLLTKSNTQDIPDGPVVKNLPTSSEDTVSVPGLGRQIPHAMGKLSPCTITSEHTSATTDPTHPRACALQ